MVGLGLNRAKVSPDNALARVLNRTWMELEATEPHTNLILKVSQEVPLWLWDLKNTAMGSRNQLQPDADGATEDGDECLDGTSPHPPQAWL